MREFWTVLRETFTHDPSLDHAQVGHVATFLALLFLVSGTAFSQFQPHPVPGLPGLVESSVAWGDYDNDGFLDLFIAGTTDTLGGGSFDPAKNFTKIFHNNGDGTFADSVTGLVPVFVATAAWGDYDRDGYLDLVYGGVDTANAQVTKLYHNNHDGTFTEVANSFHSASYGALAWGDFNNDGWIDLLIGAYDLAGPVTKLYKNNGNGTFSEETGTGLTGVNGHSKVAWGDFNNDGYQDIVLCGRTNSDSETDPAPVTKVFFNHQGDGTFAEDTAAHLVGIWKGGMSVGDLNNDGKVDILLGGAYTGITENNDTTIAYLNNGDGTFAGVAPGIDNVLHAFVILGDYDADGHLDAIVNGYNSGSGVFHGSGDGTFTQAALGLPEFVFGSVAFGDFNNDGYHDYIAAGAEGNTGRDSTVLFINVGPGTSTATPYAANTKPNPPSTLQAVVVDSSVTFTWNHGTDDNTPAAGLTYNLRVGATPTGAEVVSPLADASGLRLIAKPGNTFHDTTWTVSGLADGVYYWSVQSVDNAFAGSSFATSDSFRIGPPPLPPVTPLTWYQDTENPYSFGFSSLLEPSVVYDSTHNRFDLWASDGHNVVHAQSADGRIWEHNPSEFMQDVASDFGMSVLYGVNVVRVDTLYYMYVTNYRSDGNFDIGLMTSSDGLHWTKHPASPVIAVGAPGSWNPTGAALARVTKRDSLFLMAFGAGDSVHGYIGVATSRDGIAWEQYGGNPVITYGDTGSASEQAVRADGLTVANGEFRMAVRALDFQNHPTVYLYGSTDGLHWTKSYPDSFLVAGAAGSWNHYRINGGTLLFLNGDYHHWYNAQSNAGSSWKIGQISTDSTVTKRISLTVELSSFTATPVGNRVTLHWTTLSETGNKAFFVQRRLDTVQTFADIPGAELPGFDTTNQIHNYTYVDSNLAAGTYYYRLRQMSEDSTSHYSAEVEAVVTLVGVAEMKEGVPREYALQQNYPNPFNPSTMIQFGLPKDSRVTLEVYNVIGQRISVLVDQTMPAGYHAVRFDGQKLASGVYYYRLQARALNATSGEIQEFVQTRKLMLLK